MAIRMSRWVARNGPHWNFHNRARNSDTHRGPSHSGLNSTRSVGLQNLLRLHLRTRTIEQKATGIAAASNGRKVHVTSILVSTKSPFVRSRSAPFSLHPLPAVSIPRSNSAARKVLGSLANCVQWSWARVRSAIGVWQPGTGTTATTPRARESRTGIVKNPQHGPHLSPQCTPAAQHER